MTTQVMSSRERVRLALEHKATDRVPIALVCSGINREACRQLEDYLQRERGTTLRDYLAPLIDIKDVGTCYRGPALAAGTDMWGVRRKPVSYGAGVYNEIDVHPLATASTEREIAAYPFPEAAWFDYEAIGERIAALYDGGEQCLMAWCGTLFETAWYMRGMENLFIDLATAPDLAQALLKRVTDFHVDYIDRVLQAGRGRLDLVFTGDDIAGQNGLLMSYAMLETHIKPHHARLNQVIHNHGVKVIYHSDGGVMEAVPGLLEMGIDVLQALQFDAQGMDAGVLKTRFGERLCFEGGISVQTTLPFGTPDAVRAEVRERRRVLGKHGGYILGPSHGIQDGTPPENIVAMFDEAVAP